MMMWQIDEYWYMSDAIFIIWGLAGLAYILLVCLIVLALFNKRMAGWKMLPRSDRLAVRSGNSTCIYRVLCVAGYKVIDGGYRWSTKIEI
jgi:hypothetical protein